MTLLSRPVQGEEGRAHRGDLLRALVRPSQARGQREQPLLAFQGRPALGSWTLIVTDTVTNGNVGTLGGWALDLEQACPTSTPTVTRIITGMRRISALPLIPAVLRPAAERFRSAIPASRPISSNESTMIAEIPASTADSSSSCALLEP